MNAGHGAAASGIMEGDMNRSQRILAYDALRVLAIVTVIAIHTLMPYRALLGDHAPVRVLDDLLHYAVPLFVFISGVFVWGRPEAASGPGSATLGRRIAAIAVPYLAWSIVYMGLRIATDGPPGAGRAVGLLLTGHTWYHLYFIPMLLTFYLLGPLARRILSISPELLLFLAYALRIVAGPSLTGLARSAAGDLGWSYATHILTHLPHMALGAWFARRSHVLPRSAAFAAILAAIGTLVLGAASLDLTGALPAVARRLVFPVGMAATVLGLALGARALEPHLQAWARPIEHGGALAFGAYFIHPILLLGVTAAVSAWWDDRLWLVSWVPIAVFVAVTSASFGLARLLAGSRFTCGLIGITRPW